MRPIQLRVRSEISFPHDLPAEVAKEIKAKFTYKNPLKTRLIRMGKWAGNVEPEIKNWSLRNGVLYVPRGGTEKVRTALAKFGLRPAWSDERVDHGEIEWSIGPNAAPMEVRDYQEIAIEQLLRRENALYRAATGSGKTESILELIRRLSRPSLVVVWEKSLVKQWVDRACLRWGWDPEDVGIIGGGEYRIRQFTVAMQQSLYRKPEVASKFSLVCYDECSRVPAKTFRAMSAHLPGRWRYGVSADEKRKDGLESLTFDLFGDAAAETKKEWLIESGQLCDVDIVLVPTGWKYPPLTELETRMIELHGEVPSDVRAEFLSSKWAEIVNAVSADPERSELVARMAVEHAARGEFVIVFVERVDHARDLFSRITARGETCGLMIGGVESSEVFDVSLRLLKAGKIRVVVGTQKVYQGLDVPRLSVGICAAVTAGNQQVVEQQIGRLRRRSPGKERGTLYYLWDSEVFLSHERNLRRWYKGRVSISR